MNWLRRLAWLAFLIPSLAWAADDPLRDVGPLIFSGRGVEAREQLLKAREVFAAEGKTSQEAVTTLLLGMVEGTLSNEDAARGYLQQAADRFSAHGDQFGAWLSLWSLATLESNEGATRQAIAAYDRIFEKLREAEAPGAGFSIASAQTLLPVFGRNVDMTMLEPLMAYPELMKPILLMFTKAISYDSYARLLIDTGDLDGAEKALGQASQAAALFGGALDGGITLHYARLRQQQWRLDEAREYYMKSLGNARTIGLAFMPPSVGSDPYEELGVLYNLSELEMLRGRLDEALAWNDRALKLVRDKGDPKREARILENRADLLHSGGRYALAFSTNEEALKLATQAGARGVEASIHANLGALHMFQGTYGSAAKHLEKAIAIYQELKEHYVEAPLWITLSEVYSLLEADSNANIALDNARKLADKTEFKLARAMVDVAAAARKITSGRRTVADMSSAAADLDSALLVFLRLPDAKGLMFTPGMEKVFREMHAFAAGSPIQEKIDVEQSAPAMFGGIARMLQGISAFQRGEYETARSHFTKALALNPSRDHKAGMLAMTGAAYWKEGNAAEAVRYFRLAAEALESTAADVKVEELLAGYLGSNRRWYFDILIEMLVQEGHTAEAFAQSERARSRAFLQMIGNHRLNEATNGDPVLAAEAENVRAAIAEREQSVIAAKPEEAAHLTADLERAREHYRALLIRMKATNPEYEDITNVAPLQIDAVRQGLPPATTLISYYVSSRFVHAWVIDRDSAQYERLQLDTAGLRPLLCWANTLGSREARGIEVPNPACKNSASATDAYRALMAPLRKHIRNKRLLLVPHGALHYIPFAALRDPESNRYLVQDHTLLYAPSASALRFLSAKETPVDGEALIIGDPASPLRNLLPLPGAEEEARSVARFLGAKPHLGADAQEALLYNLNGKVDLVHIAAHAMYDASNPLFSRIALAADDKRDGSLTVTEILSTIDLKGVNLVVLSACRSAVGQRSGGDEIVGLTRALLYAGTPGVISTLWNIDDVATAGVMDDFYRHLGKGASAADALRDAQLAAITDPVHNDPRYWAAFLLTGDPQGRWKFADSADSTHP